MARDEISVLLTTADDTNSVETGVATETAVTVANGIAIKEAFANKDNSLCIVIYNSASADKTVTFKKGDMSPNATLLGDLAITAKTGKRTVVKIQNLARFENKDGTLNVDFGTGFAGTIFATAKRAGLKPVG